MSTQEMVQAFIARGGKIEVCPPRVVAPSPQLSHRRLKEVRKEFEARVS